MEIVNVSFVFNYTTVIVALETDLDLDESFDDIVWAASEVAAMDGIDTSHAQETQILDENV